MAPLNHRLLTSSVLVSWLSRGRAVICSAGPLPWCKCSWHRAHYGVSTRKRHVQSALGRRANGSSHPAFNQQKVGSHEGHVWTDLRREAPTPCPGQKLPSSSEGRDLPFSFLLLGRALTKSNQPKVHLLLLPSPNKLCHLAQSHSPPI